MTCVFCSLDKERYIDENEFAFVVRDIRPVSQGHSLIISKRHLESIFELNNEEITGMLSLVKKIRDDLKKEFNPAAFNIGINDGKAAGQTVMHSHIHLIPRYGRDYGEGVRKVVR